MRVALLLLALAGILLTFRLGFWQLDRAAQKLAWQASIAERGQLPALQAQDLTAVGADAQLHRRVHLRGHWLADKTVFLDNRPMQGRVGFFVVTPLQLEGSSQAVLVQRGWAPRDAQDRSRLPPLATPAGWVEIEGRLAASPSRLYEFSAAASGRCRPAKALWLRLSMVCALRIDPGSLCLVPTHPTPSQAVKQQLTPSP